MPATDQPTTVPPPAAGPLVLASDAQEAEAVTAVRRHHAELAGSLQTLVSHLVAAAAAAPGQRPLPTAVDAARSRLVAFLTDDLLPHALAEEEALYPAAAALPAARLLVEAMIDEHRLIQRLVDDLTSGDSAVPLAATARALETLFESHLAKENDLVLPLLAADHDVRLAVLLEGMHELLGSDAGDTPGGCGGACGCSERDEGIPELDARTVPHAIRHATVFGAFDAVGPGGRLDLVAPHDPVPLLTQLDDRVGGGLGVEYLERGPEAWRVRLTRP